MLSINCCFLVTEWFLVLGKKKNNNDNDPFDSFVGLDRIELRNFLFRGESQKFNEITQLNRQLNRCKIANLRSQFAGDQWHFAPMGS